MQCRLPTHHSQVVVISILKENLHDGELIVLVTVPCYRLVHMHKIILLDGHTRLILKLNVWVVLELIAIMSRLPKQIENCENLDILIA